MEDNFDKYIGVNQNKPDPYIQKCIDLYDVNKSTIKLISNQHDIFHFDKEIKEMDEEFIKIAPHDISSKEMLYEKYEEQRIQNMALSIRENHMKVKDTSDEKSLMVVIVGYNHLTRLQERLKKSFSEDRQMQNCEIFSLRILPKNVEPFFLKKDFLNKLVIMIN